MSDLAQILLHESGPLGIVICCALFALLWLALRYLAAFVGLVWFLVKSLKRPFLRVRWKTAVLIGIGGTALYLIRWHAIDAIQYAEGFYLHPVYLTADTSAHATAVYESLIARHCDPDELEIVKRRTREIAGKVGSTPLSIYEVAYSECGMNPFAFNIDDHTGDTLAAGWIQFTPAGLSGLGCSMKQVKKACRERNTELIMNLTEAYLIDRAKGMPLTRPCDVYCCIFAPGYLGRPDNQVLYSTADGAAYAKNAGLDGFYTAQKNGRTVVLNSVARRDGAITVGDLRLCLESRKAGVLSN